MPPPVGAAHPTTDANSGGSDLDLETLAVASHRALNALAVVAGSVSTVQMRWGALDLADVERLLGAATERLGEVSRFLVGLAQGRADAAQADGHPLAAFAEQVSDETASRRSL